MKKLVAVIIMLILMINLTCCANQKQNDSYNNGICPICGTAFHFVNITHAGYQGYKYIYACDNEHTIICSEEQHAHQIKER